MQSCPSCKSARLSKLEGLSARTAKARCRGARRPDSTGLGAPRGTGVDQASKTSGTKRPRARAAVGGTAVIGRRADTRCVGLNWDCSNTNTPGTGALARRPVSPAGNRRPEPGRPRRTIRIITLYSAGPGLQCFALCTHETLHRNLIVPWRGRRVGRLERHREPRPPASRPCRHDDDDGQVALA